MATAYAASAPAAPTKLSRYVDYTVLYGALLSTVFFAALSKYAAQSDDGAPASNLLNQLVWSSLYLIAGIRLIAMRREVIPLLARSKWLCALIVFMLASTMWSVEPGITLSNAIELAGTTAIGIFFAVRFTLAEALETLTITIGIVAILSFALIFGAPGHGRMDYGSGAWSGVFQEKNNLGAEMSLGILASMLLLLKAGQRGKPLIALVFTSCVALLVGAQSMTAAGDCGVVTLIVLSILACRSERYGSAARVVVAAGAVLTIVGLAFTGISSDGIFGAIGRSSTLTGRTDFWPYLQQAIADQPIFGYGYDAFFRSSSGAHYLSYYIVEAGGWSPYHAHNSFLQVCLDGGYVGLALLIVILVSAVGRTLRFALTRASTLGAWPVTIVIYLIVGSFTETYLDRANTLEWILFVAATLYPLTDRKVPQS